MVYDKCKDKILPCVRLCENEKLTSIHRKSIRQIVDRNSLFPPLLKLMRAGVFRYQLRF